MDLIKMRAESDRQKRKWLEEIKKKKRELEKVVGVNEE